MNLNSDLGEKAGHDVEIMGFIDSANVCCGAHAGSPMVTIETSRVCREQNVQVGAHPGYDDRENFGRTELPLTVDELEGLVRFQVAAIAAVGPIGYIKAHGALYHRCQDDPLAADALARVARDFRVGLMGQPGFEILAACKRFGVRGYREAFADRAYLADGRLAPRSQPGSVLAPQAAAEQALRLIDSGQFDTMCVHGDSPGAVDVARSIREALDRSGVKTGPLGP